jgi:glycosyltransferase involved in cell wall biosynthesis
MTADRRQPHILFVSNEASRTGAPLMLLHFLRWFARNVAWTFNVVLVRGGPLQPEFEALGPTLALDQGVWRGEGFIRSNLERRGWGGISSAIERIAYTRRLGLPPDLIYCNSAASAPAMNVLGRWKSPVLTHVHELMYSFRVAIPRPALDSLMARTTQYIACANFVREYLINNEGVNPSSIEVIHEFLVPDRFSLNGVPSSVEAESSTRPFVVGGVGSISWRKGTDLFVQVAKIIRDRFPARDVRFLWVGTGERIDIDKLTHEIRSAGLGSVISLCGAVENPAEHYRGMDILLLPSREDPYPLACLEAAAAGKPIVCFDGAGGAREFVQDDCGFLVPYLDVGAMAERVVRLLTDSRLRRHMGDAARRKVFERHNLETAAPRILAAMERALRKERDTPPLQRGPAAS